MLSPNRSEITQANRVLLYCLFGASIVMNLLVYFWLISDNADVAGALWIAHLVLWFVCSISFFISRIRMNPASKQRRILLYAGIAEIAFFIVEGVISFLILLFRYGLHISF